MKKGVNKKQAKIQMKVQTKKQVLVVAAAKVNNRRKQQRNLTITLLLFMIVGTPFHLMILKKVNSKTG